jgi:hypothetical protein
MTDQSGGKGTVLTEKLFVDFRGDLFREQHFREPSLAVIDTS